MFRKNSLMKPTITYLLAFFLSLSAPSILIPNALATMGGEEHLQRGIRVYLKAAFGPAAEELKSAIQEGLADKRSLATAYEYLAFCESALGHRASAKRYFKQAIQAYVSLNPDRRLYSPPLLKSFTEAKTELPIISDFMLMPQVFYPLKGETTAISYKLSRDAKVQFFIQNASASDRVWETQSRGVAGKNLFVWNGKDTTGQFIGRGDYTYSLLSSTDSDQFFVEKRVRVSLHAPYGVELKNPISTYPGREYRGHIASIPGLPKKSLLSMDDIRQNPLWKQPMTELPDMPKKSETKAVKKPKTGWLVAGIGGGLLIGAMAVDISNKPITCEYISGQSYDTREHRTQDVRSATLTAIGTAVAGWILSEIQGEKRWVSIPENKAYNQQVEAEIAKRNRGIEAENVRLLNELNDTTRQYNAQVEAEILKRNKEIDTYNAETQRLIREKNQEIEQENQRIKQNVKMVQEIIE